MKNKNFKLLFGVLLTLALILAFTATAWAAEPAHSKTVIDNEDGTYKIQLTVTGDADLPDQTQNTVNVLVVYDVSQSMSNGAGTGRSRGKEAENVVHGFLQTLLEKHNSSSNITVNTALVTFGVNATPVVGWNPISQNFVNRFRDGSQSGTAFNYTSTGTNWEEALQAAQTYLNSATTDPTFVIFITDGAPTRRDGSGQATPSATAPWTTYRQFYAAATD